MARRERKGSEAKFITMGMFGITPGVPKCPRRESAHRLFGGAELLGFLVNGRMSEKQHLRG